MKKTIYLLSSILLLSTSVYAKEMAVKPTSSKEMVEVPVAAVEEVVVAPAPIPVPVDRTYLNLRIGGDISPRYDAIKFADEKLNSKSAKDWGGEIAVELMHQLWGSNFDAGLGVAYQRHAGVKKAFSEDDITRYDSIPIYATARYNVGDWNGWTPYVKADIGYSFNLKDHSIKIADQNISTKIKNGMYWGAGLGVEYYNWTADIMYKMNTAKAKLNDGIDSSSSDFDYGRVTLSVGYAFDL
ncbi:outer membrane protein [Cetobacterium sp. SF1]|uniref:outer membrane protein n=1 Tax=Cetobacterium sp. SF1 TaxID=3417654 RepID=UPI003CE81E9C